MSEKLAVNGDTAIAMAWKQINPDVVAAYPITPRPSSWRPSPITFTTDRWTPSTFARNQSIAP